MQHHNSNRRKFFTMVVSVGVDVSKGKHDCFILSSEGEVLADVFTIIRVGRN